MAKVAKVRDIDRGLAAALKRIASGKFELTVGVHSQDGDEPKKGDEEEGTKLIDVAVAHEFGLGVPRRSFIADWQDENADLHKKQVVQMGKAIVKGTLPSGKVAAERLGARWVGDVQKRIVAHIPPPLSDATIKRKGSSTPLIDTGQLKSSIAFAVDGALHPSQNFEQAERKRVATEKRAAKKQAAAKKKARKKDVQSAKKTIKAATKAVAKTKKKVVRNVKKTAARTKKRIAAAARKRRKAKPKAKKKKP